MVSLDQIGNWARPFLRSMLSEPDGTGSNTRVCILLVICFALGWVTALVCRVRGPVTVAEIGALLVPLGTFIGLACAPLYAMNKWADVKNNQARENSDHPQQ